MFWLIIGLMSVITAILGALSLTLSENVQQYRYDIRELAFAEVSAAAQQYYLETGVYPASLNTLVSAPGFEYLKAYAPSDKGGFRVQNSVPLADVAVSGTLNDGIWQYSRMMTYSLKDLAFGASNFMAAANNKCGANTFLAGVDWCGADYAAHFEKLEMRNDYLKDMTRIKNAQFRLLSKLVQYFNKNGEFPNPGSASVTLISIVPGAAALTAKSCSGEFVWNGMPFGCEDLFSPVGQPTKYAYTGTKEIFVTTDTPIKNNSGTAISVASELSL